MPWDAWIWHARIVPGDAHKAVERGLAGMILLLATAEAGQSKAAVNPCSPDLENASRPGEL